jgi:hypothetical protein
MFAGFPFRALLIVLKIAPVKRRSKRLVAHYWELREKVGSVRVEMKSVVISGHQKIQAASFPGLSLSHTVDSMRSFSFDLMPFNKCDKLSEWQ